MDNVAFCFNSTTNLHNGTGQNLAANTLLNSGKTNIRETDIERAAERISQNNKKLFSFRTEKV